MLLIGLSFPINYESFHQYLVKNVPNADGLVTTENGYEIIEKVTFNNNDIDFVNSYYNGLTEAGELAKSQPTVNEKINNSITAAAEWGGRLCIQYATSNVLQGITQAGKTQIVADYLRPLAYYLKSGSLYAAIDEMNNMISDVSDSKTTLLPYITNDILYEYLNYIQTYLQIPLTVNPGK